MDITVLAKRIATLSDSQRKILALLAQGLDNDQIAERIGESKGYVSTKVSGIYSRLQLAFSLGNNARREMLARAWRVFENMPRPGSEGASAQKTNGHDTDPPPEHDVLRATDEKYGMSTFIPLQKLPPFKDIQILVSDSPTFEAECFKLVRAGYTPQFLIDYQSLSHFEQSVTKIVFVKYL